MLLLNRAHVAIVAWSILASGAYAAEIEMGNRVAVKMEATTSFSQDSGKVRYGYGLRSLPSSSQPIEMFVIRNEAPVTSTDCPKGWDGWQFKGRSLWGWVAWEEDYYIAPGSTVFSYQLTSLGLPGVEKYYVQGDTPVPVLSEEEEVNPEILAQVRQLSDVEKNSVSGLSIGPTATTINSSPAEIVNHLLAQTKTIANLGWIDNQGIETSLEKKLNGALAALNKNETKTARNKLKAFLHEVLEKSGRHEEKEDEKRREREEARAHIKQNAVAILGTGAEVAIYKLGGDPKKHEDDDD